MIIVSYPGELRVRSAKVSNIPGHITRGFFAMVFNRAFPVVMDGDNKTTDKMFGSQDFMLTLDSLNGFDG